MSFNVMAQETGAKKAGDFLIRGRAIAFVPVEGTNVPALGGQADASNDYVPELDFTYFITDNIAVELIAATTKHNMDLNDTNAAGDVDMGEVWVLPPVLTLQYHFDEMTDLNLSPYLGAGVNYTVFYNSDAQPGSAAEKVKYHNSFGYALQGGVDMRLDDNWFLNLDVKKVFLDVDLDVTLNGGAVIDAEVALDPWVVGVGVGYKF